MISYIRGDDKKIIFQRINKSDKTVIKTKPEKIYFTVKYDFNQEEALIIKTFDKGVVFNENNYTYNVIMEPKDTNNLPFGKYVFDIEVIENNKKNTILVDELELKGEVTHQCNEDTIIIEEIDYNLTKNKPQINGVELFGNKTTEDLGINIPDTSNFATNEDIKDFIKKDVEDLQNYTKTTDLEKEYAKKEEIKEPFKEVSGDSINVWELEQGNHVTTEKAYIYLQTGSSIEFNPRTIIVISDKEDGKKQYSILDNAGHVYYGSIANDGTPEENGNYSLDISKTLAYDNDFEYEVTSDYNPAHKKYVDGEVGDCYYTLDKNINEENDKQTIMNINAKDGSYSQVLCVDSIDIKQEIPTIDVLSAQKGRDLNERLGVIESKNLVETSDLEPITSRITKLEETPIKVIEVNAEMTEDNKTNHEYPELQLSEEQVQIVLNNNISILKANYTITDHNNGTETDTLVFYTTIDDEKVISGRNTVDTIKINAIRRNNEGILVYHGEMVGNGSEYYQKVTLTATYNANTPVVAASNLWG